ncbi:MAG: 3-isopropylmalate dehydrogenase, partial [Nitrospinae bacterium]|nr:3-isopropylmalate dehydrogenase [Nitrospinota bacterium]
MKKILVIKGDGIGPEIVDEALIVLKKMAEKHAISLEFQEALAGGAAYDATGHPLPDETLRLAKEADAILLGAVGGPKWEGLDYSVRPERALLGLRSELRLYSNLRPA